MLSNFISPLVLFATVILISGCNSNNPTQPDTNKSNIPSSRFSDIQNKVLTNTCALAGCHGATDNQADLLLLEGEAYTNLVNVQSLLFPEYKRIVPDSSSRSLIIKILKGEVSPQMPLDSEPLPADVIDSIAAWIDNGALNN